MIDLILIYNFLFKILILLSVSFFVSIYLTSPIYLEVPTFDCRPFVVELLLYLLLFVYPYFYLIILINYVFFLLICANNICFAFFYFLAFWSILVCTMHCIYNFYFHLFFLILCYHTFPFFLNFSLTHSFVDLIILSLLDLVVQFDLLSLLCSPTRQIDL